MNPTITLTRDPLETLTVDAIGYGAKDTGEMGGGAAAAVLAAAGPEILPQLQSKLTGSPCKIGDLVVTDSFKLKTIGIQWVFHIISIIKHTPEGAYCPHPKRLGDGVASALQNAAALGARSIAFSALGTGEGRVKPSDAARYMLDGVKVFTRSRDHESFSVTFSLPSYRDYEAFRAVIQDRWR